MTPNQYLWAQARDRLAAAVTGIGFPAELAELMARQLGSPKAIDRMTSYVHQARPRTEEMLVDEMLPNSSRATPLCGSATSPGASPGCQPGAAGACPLGSSAGA